MYQSICSFKFYLQDSAVTALILAALLILSTTILSAEEIYKSVDRDGNVSYSSTPAADAVKVETIEPPQEPDPVDVERAEENLATYKKQQQKAEEQQQERAQQKALVREAAEEFARAYRPPPVEVYQPMVQYPTYFPYGSYDSYDSYGSYYPYDDYGSGRYPRSVHPRVGRPVQSMPYGSHHQSRGLPYRSNQTIHSFGK